MVPFSITLDSSISVFRQIIRDRPGILEDFEKMAIFSPIFQLLKVIKQHFMSTGLYIFRTIFS